MTVEMSREDFDIALALAHGWNYEKSYPRQKLKNALWYWQRSERGQDDFLRVEMRGIPNFEESSALCDMLLEQMTWFDIRNLRTAACGPSFRVSFQWLYSEAPHTVHYAPIAQSKNLAIALAYYQWATAKRVVIKETEKN